MVTENELAYLAGIVDGEGTIGILKFRQMCKAHGPAYSSETQGKAYGYNTRYVLRVSVGMTDAAVPKWLCEEFGGTLYHREQQEANWKSVWVWDARAMLAGTFLTQIEPYLIVKKQQAAVALSFQAQRIAHLAKNAQQKEADEGFYQTMKRLNHRGK